MASMIEQRLQALYAGCGYQPFRVKKFERYELYSENRRFLTTEKVLTFTNTDGRLMAMKPDVTLSIVQDTQPDGLRKVFVFHHQRHFIDKLRVIVLNNMACRHITEKRNLILDFLRHRLLGTAYQDVCLQSQSLEFTDTHLCRLGFKLLGCMQIRHKRHMDHDRILMANIMLELANRLKKRLRLYIADGAADLNDCNPVLIRIL